MKSLGAILQHFLLNYVGTMGDHAHHITEED